MAATLEQPKKAVTAYWLWLSENRDSIAKDIGTSKGAAVAKAAGEKWKSLSEAAKAPFEKRAAAQKEEYAKAMEDFKSQGGVPQKRQRKEKDVKGKKAKGVKDENAPKKPVGGAYGIFLAENREAIKKSLPADHKITDVTKVAGERWRALSEDAKKPYEAKFAEAVAAYKKAMEDYKKNAGADAGEEEGEEEGEAEPEAEEVPQPAAKRSRGRKAGA